MSDSNEPQLAPPGEPPPPPADSAIPPAAPDGALALAILVSGLVGSGIASLAISEGMIEIYQNMGVALPKLLQLGLAADLPVLCGVGGALLAFAVYLVSSGRIRSPAAAKGIRTGAAILSCVLFLWAVAAREGMQTAIEDLQRGLSLGPGVEPPPPVPGEVQALTRELVKAVELGLKTSKEGSWTLRAPGGIIREFAVPSGKLGNCDWLQEAAITLPPVDKTPLSLGDPWERVQLVSTPSVGELCYGLVLERAQLDTASLNSDEVGPDGRLDESVDAFQDGLYRLRVYVFRGPPGPGGYLPVAGFETVLR